MKANVAKKLSPFLIYPAASFFSTTVAVAIMNALLFVIRLILQPKPGDACILLNRLFFLQTATKWYC